MQKQMLLLLQVDAQKALWTTMSVDCVPSFFFFYTSNTSDSSSTLTILIHNMIEFTNGKIKAYAHFKGKCRL